MADLVLQIQEPAHDAYVAAADPVRLRATAAGTTAGMFFKWYSTLNPGATVAQPELNAAHGAASLDFLTQLDVGSHVITLAAADQESSAMAAVTAITRAAFAGGAPDPSNPAPRVVHRLRATLKSPLENGTLSKASATIEMRAPLRWSREAQPGVYVPDAEYRALHKIQYRLELKPDGPPDPARTASVVPDLAASTFFLEGPAAFLRWQGALPAQLGTGAYVLTLFVEKPDRSVQHSAIRRVNLTA